MPQLQACTNGSNRTSELENNKRHSYYAVAPVGRKNGIKAVQFAFPPWRQRSARAARGSAACLCRCELRLQLPHLGLPAALQCPTGVVSGETGHEGRPQ